MSSPAYTLESLFHIQRQTIEAVHGSIPIKDQKLLNHYILAAFVELGEAIQNTDWKQWRKTKSVPKKALEELVDVQKFLLNAVILLGFTSRDFEKMFVEKSLIVFQRIKNESK